MKAQDDLPALPDSTGCEPASAVLVYKGSLRRLSPGRQTTSKAYDLGQSLSLVIIQCSDKRKYQSWEMRQQLTHPRSIGKDKNSFHIGRRQADLTTEYASNSFFPHLLIL